MSARVLGAMGEEPHLADRRFLRKGEILMSRLGFVLTIAAVLAGAPVSAQQQPAPDQGNGNWDPPPVTGPTTTRLEAQGAR